MITGRELCEQLQIENAALKRALKAFMTQLGNAESDRDAAQEREGKLLDRVAKLCDSVIDLGGEP